MEALREPEYLSGEVVVMPTVLEVLTQARAYGKAEIRIDSDIAVVKELVDVAS